MRCLTGTGERKWTEIAGNCTVNDGEESAAPTTSFQPAERPV